jgi:hypothetical protein
MAAVRTIWPSRLAGAIAASSWAHDRGPGCVRWQRPRDQRRPAPDGNGAAHKLVSRVAISLRRAVGVSESHGDVLGRLARVVVFPHSDNRPPCCCQGCVCVLITAPVAFELLGPPRRIGLGLLAMLRASVPEAAIDEDRDALPRENDVDSSSMAGQHRQVHPVPQPKGVERLPKSDFRGRVSRALSLQSRPYRLR